MHRSSYSAAHPPRSVTEYVIGWLCALPGIEDIAARVLLDDEFDPPEDIRTTSAGLQFSFGRMGSHNVVITCLPENDAGVRAAAQVMDPMKTTFPYMDTFILAGICGGFPKTVPDTRETIQLGDVIIGVPGKTLGDTGTIAYREGRYTDAGLENTKTIDKGNEVLRRAAAQVCSNYIMRSNLFEGDLVRFKDKSRFLRPELPDMLFRSDYGCLRNQETYGQCLNCDPNWAINRGHRMSSNMVLHSGSFLSGDLVVRSANYRDELAANYPNALGLETEAAGVEGCLIVRGVSDYLDDHKNDDWRGWAAARAASVAKQIILTANIMPKGEASRGTEHYPDHRYHKINATTKVLTTFRAFDDVCETLKSFLIAEARSEGGSRVCVLYGRPGGGKSALCDYFYDKNRNKYWAAWRIAASTTASIEKGFVNIACSLGLSSRDSQQSDEVISSVKNFLESQNRHWIILLDNADDENILYGDLFPNSPVGSVLITSRTINCCWNILPKVLRLQIPELRRKDSIQLLSEWINVPGKPLIRQASYNHLGRVADRLSNLPSALRLAGTTVAKRLQWNKLKPVEDVISSYLMQLDSPDGDHQNLCEIWTPYKILLEDMLDRTEGPDEEQRVRDAQEILDFFAFLSPGDISIELFEYILENLPQQSSRPLTSDLDFSTYMLDILKNDGTDSNNGMARIESALTLLHDYSFIDWVDIETPSKIKISIHPLIQECARVSSLETDTTGDTKALKALFTMSQAMVRRPTNSPSRMLSFRRAMMPHVDLLRKLYNDNKKTRLFGDLSLKHVAQLELTISMAYFETGKLQEALKQQCSILDQLQAITEPQDPLCLKVRALIATTRHVLNGPGDRDQAYDDRSNLLRDWEALLETNPNTSRALYIAALSDFADSCDSVWTKSTPLRGYCHRQRVLEELKEARFPTEFETVDAKRRFARTCHLIGKREEAYELRKEVSEYYDQRRSVDQKRDELSLVAEGDLAESLSDKGYLIEAMILREVVLSERRTLLGEKHLDTLAAESSLARSHCQMRQGQEALALQMHVYKTLKEVYGFRHPSTLQSYTRLGKIFSFIGYHWRAYQVHKEAYEDGWKKLTKDDQEIASDDIITSMTQMAVCLDQKAQFRKHDFAETAEHAFNAAMSLRLEVYENQKVRTPRSYEALLLARSGIASTCSAFGYYETACDQRKRILEEYTQHVLRIKDIQIDDTYVHISRRLSEDYESLLRDVQPIYLPESAANLPSSSNAADDDSSTHSSTTLEGSNCDEEDFQLRIDSWHLSRRLRNDLVERAKLSGQGDANRWLIQAKLDYARRLIMDAVPGDDLEAISTFKEILEDMRQPLRYGEEHPDVLQVESDLKKAANQIEVDKWQGTRTGSD